MLSPEESAALDRFMEKGGKVYENTYTYWNTLCIGFKLYEKRQKEYKERVYDLAHTVYDVADLENIHPQATSLDPNVQVQLLQGEGYKLMVLTNISTTKPSMDASVRCRFAIKSSKAMAFDGDKEVCVTDGVLTVKSITDGCVIRVEE